MKPRIEKRAVPVALGPTQDQTSAAISIRRVARLSRDVGQPDHILANPIMSHKAELVNVLKSEHFLP